MLGPNRLPDAIRQIAEHNPHIGTGNTSEVLCANTIAFRIHADNSIRIENHRQRRRGEMAP